MKLLIIAVITLVHGGSIEVVVQSLEQCEAAMLALRQGAKIEITEQGGVAETVISIDCKPTEVLTPEAEGEDV